MKHDLTDFHIYYLLRSFEVDVILLTVGGHFLYLILYSEILFCHHSHTARFISNITECLRTFLDTRVHYYGYFKSQTLKHDQFAYI